MKFIVDECTGPAVAHWLHALGHEVYSVYEQSPGMSDQEILSKAINEDWVIITNDKDFGERVFRDHFAHHGIIFMRLQKESTKNKITVLEKVMNEFLNQLHDEFVVVSENQIRFGIR